MPIRDIPPVVPVSSLLAPTRDRWRRPGPAFTTTIVKHVVVHWELDLTAIVRAHNGVLLQLVSAVAGTAASSDIDPTHDGSECECGMISVAALEVSGYCFWIIPRFDFERMGYLFDFIVCNAIL